MNLEKCTYRNLEENRKELEKIRKEEEKRMKEEANKGMIVGEGAMKLKKNKSLGSNMGSGNYIGAYNYSPKYNLTNADASDDDKLYIGFEFECQRDRRDDDRDMTRQFEAKKVVDIIGDDKCFVVGDSTTENHGRVGMEIVSHPMTLKAHMEVARWEDMIKYLSSVGYKDFGKTSTCGMHVHINRNFFEMDDVDSINKLAVIIENNWLNICKVARRKENRYSQRLYIGDSPIKNVKTIDDAGKYSALNTQHKNTYELRMFSGTMSYTELMATLEFVRNLAYIAKEKTYNECKLVEFEDIVEYKPTKYLKPYIEARKIYY